MLQPVKYVDECLQWHTNNSIPFGNEHMNQVGFYSKSFAFIHDASSSSFGIHEHKD